MRHAAPELHRHLHEEVSKGWQAVQVIVGARQTGKTTLCKREWPLLPYFSLDDAEIRQVMARIPASLWAKDIGNAVIDECQKLPELFEKIKYAWDARSLEQCVLTGSSQLLLMQKVRESLAGRVQIHECWPLMLSELAVETAGDKPPVPILASLLASNDSLDDILSKLPEQLLGVQNAIRRKAEQTLLKWGGMPALFHLEESHKEGWLRDYIQTFLERDLADLARLNDLEPFRKFQKICALRSGGILSYSELAKDCGVSVDTSRRWLEYLNISFQIILLQPYYRNLTSRSIKSPKLYWSDLGLQRKLAGRGEMITGEIFETFVISEIYKWLHTLRSNVQMMYYRTTSGLEVDLLLESPFGVVGCEMKMREQVDIKDARNLIKIAEALKEQWKGGLVIYSGDRMERICEPGIWAMPAHRLLS